MLTAAAAGTTAGTARTTAGATGTPTEPAGTPAGAYAFYASGMKVQLKLLHEEDLTRLLGDLRQQAAALIQVKACNVSRVPRGAGDSSVTAQLQADCLIDWITLREAAGKPGTQK